MCGVFANGSDPIDCGECARPTPLTLEQARDELQVYPELGAELANPTSDYSRLLQTYVDAGRACHDGAWQQCLQIVEDFGVTNRPVYRIPGNAPRSNNLGDPAFYYALRVLEDAARTMAGGGAAATSPLAFTVVLFDRAEAGSNLDARFRRSASLDPKIEENGYLAVREALSDFDFLVRYWSQGRFGINLRIVRANQTVRVDNGLGAETGHEVPDFDAMSRIPTAVRTDTNLMLLVFPNMLEDYRDETIIIGGNGGTTTFCNDQWLLQKRGSLGHGPYASLERRVYMINWLQHEFMHYVFSAYPDFGLERSPHQWFDRSTWPADFEGRLEPDYYHEAIAKRIHPSGSPSLNELLKRPL